MKNHMQEAYSAEYNSALARLIENFSAGASVSRKRQRGTGPATASLPNTVPVAGMAKAMANYGGDNSVSRPPDAPTPMPAKLARPPVKRWEGGPPKRKKRAGMAPVARYTGKRATVSGKV